MKEFLKGIMFWIIEVGMIVAAGAIVNVLAGIITMEMIMTVVYIMLGVCILYIFKG